MAKIRPFRATRFSAKKFSNLSKVICPPYDVISLSEHHKLMARHPNNIIRVEYPLSQKKENKYAVAASFWKRWQTQKILTQDSEPGFYGYEQRFTVGNQSYFRRGFFAALKIERPGKGCVRPHERTFPKHKEDRLNLMRTTHSNVSPIFGLFFDRKGQVQSLCETRMQEKPSSIARDDKNVTHRLWHWKDAAAIKTLQDALQKEDVLIADGHHRYETSWNFSREYKKDGAKYVMIFLCPIEDSGLVIHPTHRSVRFDCSTEEWKARIGKGYTLKRLPGLHELLNRLRDPNEHTGMAMATKDDGLYWLSPVKGKATAMPVVYLHEKILKGVPLENISYGQDAREIVLNIQRGEANAAFLLSSPDKNAFASLCRSGKLLPQKSTYFYPKVGTGLVMRTLDGEI